MKKEIIISTVIIILIIIGFNLTLMKQQGIYQAKLEIQKQEFENKINEKEKTNQSVIDSLNEEINTLSEIEILEKNANNANNTAESILETINKAKDLIARAEPEYEKAVLRHRCTLNQMERKTSNEDIDMNFCLDENNLQLFRTKKY